MMTDEKRKINLTIDGIQVEAYEGDMVLDAARRAGIDIPTLCYHPAIGPIGSCRVCVVEIENGRGLPASCVTPVREGMVVRTNTEAVREARRTVVELILASHPQDCLQCERNGRCELQALAMRLGIRETRFHREKEHKECDTSSPALVRDADKCILCGRCVNMCADVQNVAALGFAYRGTDALVTPMFERGLAESKCVSCGQCAKICPVGAIHEKEEWQKVADLISDPNLHVVVQVAPAVRAAIGEEFGIPAGTPVTVFACPADVGTELLFQRLEAISCPFHITRCSKANANCPLALWFKGEQRIESCHPINLTLRHTQAFCHEFLNIFRQTPKELLGFVEYRNKGTRLVLIFIDYIAELVEPIVRKLSMTLTFSAYRFQFRTLCYDFGRHLT
jgi:ferredoxin